MNAATIFYDDGCAFCTRWARRGSRLGFRIEPFANGAGEPELKVATPAGATLGGAAAIRYLCRQVWWLWPVSWLCGLPGAERIYRWVAANRYCLNGQCEVRR